MKFSLYKNTWHITENKETLCGHRGLVFKDNVTTWSQEDWSFYFDTQGIAKNDCKECFKIGKLICNL